MLTGQYQLDIHTSYELNVIKLINRWTSREEYLTLSTSGSTGEPKLIKLLRSNIIRSAERTIEFFKLSSADTCLICLDINHVGGMMMLIRALIARMDMIIQEPNSNPYGNIKPDILPTFVAMVPLQLIGSLAEYEASPEKFKNIRALILGGAPIDNRLKVNCQKLTFPVYQTFGMTETTSHFAVRLINGVKQLEAYQMLEGWQIKSNGNKQLMIKSDKNLADWIITNDIVEIIDDRSFEWLGRSDNVINSGGLKIHPEILESEIFKILEKANIDVRFFVIGMPDEALGERVVLVLEGKKNQQLEQKILDSLKEFLPKYLSPKDLYFTEQFKETSSGKIKRQATFSALSQ